MGIVIKRITEENKKDLNIKNEAFPLYGRMVPMYDGNEWTYKTVLFDEKDVESMTFPDENYNFEDLSKDSICVGAYDNDVCVGLAIFQHSWNKYLYLYDLKVNGTYRKQGSGRMFIEAGKEIAKEHGYIGVYTQGQDNNLAACLFYIKNGFAIGGIDTKVYTGTKQADKSDIVFYLDL